MQNKEINEFDKSDRLYVAVPERFHTPKIGQKAVASLELIPLATSQGDFDAFCYGFYSDEAGDLARQAVFQMIAQLIGELEYAKTKGINNSLSTQMAPSLLEHFSKPFEAVSIETLLNGSINIVNPRMRTSKEIMTYKDGKLINYMPIIKPPIGLPGLGGGNYQARTLQPEVYNLGLMSVCTTRRDSHMIIDNLFGALSLFIAQPGSVLNQMSADIRRIQVARAFE
ncbi:MAG TPA: hypothetical protein VMR81_01375 [Patescibacteria group bacterium]|nr:hypothetical protein [Patescibacteria group bacterium]